MQRTTGLHHVDNRFQDGNPATGLRGTRVDAPWLNFMQEEVVNAILRAGLTLDPASETQLAEAMQRLSGNRYLIQQDAHDAVDRGDLQTGDVVEISGRAVAGDGGGFRGTVTEFPNALYPGGGRIRPMELEVSADVWGISGIPDAIAFAAAHARIVTLEPREYLIGAKLAAKALVPLRGVPGKTLLKANANLPALIELEQDGRGFDISGIGIDADSRCQFALTGAAVEDVHLNDITVRNFEYGIRLESSPTKAARELYLKNIHILEPQAASVQLPLWMSSNYGDPFIEVVDMADITVEGRRDGVHGIGGTADQITLHGVRKAELRNITSLNGGEVGVTIARLSAQIRWVGGRVSGCDGHAVNIGSGAISVAISAGAAAPVYKDVLGAELLATGLVLTLDSVDGLQIGHILLINGNKKDSSRDLNSEYLKIQAIDPALKKVTLWNFDLDNPNNAATTAFDATGIQPWTGPGGRTRVEVALYQPSTRGVGAIRAQEDNLLHIETMQLDFVVGDASNGINTITISEVLRTGAVSISGVDCDDNGRNVSGEVNPDGTRREGNGFFAQQVDGLAIRTSSSTNNNGGESIKATNVAGLDVDASVLAPDGIVMFGSSTPAIVVDQQNGLIRYGVQRSVFGQNSGDAADYNGVLMWLNNAAREPLQVSRHDAPAFLAQRVGGEGMVVPVHYRTSLFEDNGEGGGFPVPLVGGLIGREGRAAMQGSLQMTEVVEADLLTYPAFLHESVLCPDLTVGGSSFPDEVRCIDPDATALATKWRRVTTASL